VSRVRLPLAALLIAAGVFFADCSAAQGYPPSVKDLVARTRAQIRTIDMARFKSALDKHEAGLVVDVREPEEYASGHVPGAINIPRGVIELSIWPYVGFPDSTDLGKRITLYCASGTRCILATKSLQDLGFTNAVAVDMRIADWAKAGYPLVME